MTDTERMDWLEETGARRLQALELFSENEKVLYSFDAGTTWHETIRAAIDAAMAEIGK